MSVNTTTEQLMEYCSEQNGYYKYTRNANFPIVCFHESFFGVQNGFVKEKWKNRFVIYLFRAILG